MADAERGNNYKLYLQLQTLACYGQVDDLEVIQRLSGWC